MSMNSYMKQFSEIPLSRYRRKQPKDKANEREMTEFRSLAGTLPWLGKGVLPLPAYNSSVLQQKLAFLKAGHLVEANAIVRDIKKLQHAIVFHQPTSVVNAILNTFSDASFNISSRKSYGQTGLISGLRIMWNDGTKLFSH